MWSRSTRSLWTKKLLSLASLNCKIMQLIPFEYNHDYATECTRCCLMSFNARCSGLSSDSILSAVSSVLVCGYLPSSLEFAIQCTKIAR